MSASSNLLGLSPDENDFLEALLLSAKGRKKIQRATSQNKAEWLETMKSLLAAKAIVIFEGPNGELSLGPNPDLIEILPN